MKNASTQLLALGLTLPLSVFADPGVDMPDNRDRGDAGRNATEAPAPRNETQSPAPSLPDVARPKVSGGIDVKRDDPKVIEALRATPWAAGPVADAFKEALHTEEVIRDLDAAATRYLALVEKHRMREDDHIEGVAAVALFRLAEIRRRQGDEEKARGYYEEIAEEFDEWEPMTSLSRQQLGLDPSDFLPQLTRLENDRRLSDQIERSLWKIRTRVSRDPFVLVTFEIEPDEENPYEGMPEKQVIRTLHYNPGGPLIGHIASTCVKGGPVRKGKVFGDPIPGTLATRLTGFGHAYDVPGGLRQTLAFQMVDSNHIGYRDTTFDAKLAFTFNDEMDDEGKELGVSFTLATLPEAEAREIAASSSVTLPETGDQRWSITLPPSPSELAEAHPAE